MLLQYTIRKDFTGNTISEHCTPIQGNEAAEIKFLGKLLADELKRTPSFSRFCEDYISEEARRVG